jgi:hypothetical protein
MDYLKKGDFIDIIFVYDNDEIDRIKQIPAIRVPDDLNTEEVRTFSLELGDYISYSIRKQAYRPIKEIRLVKG